MPVLQPAEQLKVVVETELLPRFVRILTAEPLTEAQVSRSAPAAAAARCCYAMRWDSAGGGTEEKRFCSWGLRCVCRTVLPH